MSILNLLDKKFIQELFCRKKKLFFPSAKGEISDIKIEKLSPDWAKRTCLVRYKIFFSDNSSKIIRGTAKIDGSKKRSYKIMSYLYENGFSESRFKVPRPLDYIDEIGLFIYEEAPGEPLSSIIDRNQYSLKFSQDIAEFLFKIHSIKNIKPKKKALIFNQEDYLRTYKRIRKIFPQFAEFFPLQKIHFLQELEGESSFIHGDFYTGNLIINGNKIILIDFDKAGQGPILYDLASFCYCFEFPRSIWPLSLSKANINKYQHNFLKSYAKMAGWDLSILKLRLNKYMAKVFLNALNYYTGLAEEGWSVLTEKEKRVYFIQIRDLLKKVNQYFKKI